MWLDQKRTKYLPSRVPETNTAFLRQCAYTWMCPAFTASNMPEFNEKTQITKKKKKNSRYHDDKMTLIPHTTDMLKFWPFDSLHDNLQTERQRLELIFQSFQPFFSLIVYKSTITERTDISTFWNTLFLDSVKIEE